MSEKKKGLTERVKEVVKSTIDDVMRSGQPQSVELLANDYWTLQLLVVPPSERQYGATTVRRDVSVLLTVRSNRLWRNNLTLPDVRAVDALIELLNAFKENEELYSAVTNVMTTRVTPKTVTVIKI